MIRIDITVAIGLNQEVCSSADIADNILSFVTKDLIALFRMYGFELRNSGLQSRLDDLDQPVYSCVINAVTKIKQERNSVPFVQIFQSACLILESLESIDRIDFGYSFSIV